MKNWSLALLSVGILFSFGCVSSPKENVTEVQVGMEKHDVLELMGNPKYVRRVRGVDRWGYVWYDHQSRTREEKQVHFESGMVTYIGVRPQPKITAQEQDRKNRESNQQLAVAAEQQRQQSIKNRATLADDYLNWQMGVKSNEARVPKFEPVGRQ